MELNLLLTAIATMATVIGILFRLLISGHKQQITAKDKEIDFLRKLALSLFKIKKIKILIVWTYF